MSYTRGTRLASDPADDVRDRNASAHRIHTQLRDDCLFSYQRINTPAAAAHPQLPGCAGARAQRPSAQRRPARCAAAASDSSRLAAHPHPRRSHMLPTASDLVAHMLVCGACKRCPTPLPRWTVTVDSARARQWSRGGLAPHACACPWRRCARRRLIQRRSCRSGRPCPSCRA